MHEHDAASGADLLDLNDIMHGFGIDSWQVLGPAETTQGSALHLLLEVQGKRYVLKERAEGFVGEDTSYRYDFQRFLREQDIPIPPLWRTPAGSYEVTVGEDGFELQEWAGGALYSSADPRALEWVASAGSMLGRLHQTAQRYPGPEHRWPSEAHMGAQVQNWLQLARQRAEVSEPQALAAALTEWVERFEAVLPRAMMTLGAGHVPEQHIHGDYHAHNLRFDEFGVSAVLGLEASHWEKRLFELAYGLFSFSALAWQPDEVLARPLVKRGLEPERARLFLHAYAEHCPPAPGEAALLADALTLIAPIASINGPLEDLFYASDELDQALIEDIMERLAWSAALPAWFGRARSALAEMWR